MHIFIIFGIEERKIMQHYKHNIFIEKAFYLFKVSFIKEAAPRAESLDVLKTTSKSENSISSHFFIRLFRIRALPVARIRLQPSSFISLTVIISFRFLINPWHIESKMCPIELKLSCLRLFIEPNVCRSWRSAKIFGSQFILDSASALFSARSISLSHISSRLIFWGCIKPKSTLHFRKASIKLSKLFPPFNEAATSRTLLPK